MRRIGAPSPARAATAPDGGADPSGRRGSRTLSLRARALGLLAMREYSVVELTRRLSRHAESPEALETLVGELGARGLLSDQRFAEGLARRRAQRYGIRRIERELEQHAITRESMGPLLRELADSERERALQAWRKRFGASASNAIERARQHRYLAQRGFSGETIAWVLRHAADENASRD